MLEIAPEDVFVEASTAVAARDPDLARLVAAIGSCQLRPPLESYFAALVRAIVYQQLAGRAAAAIHGRFIALLEGGLQPAAVLALPEERIRTAGLSGSKTASILDLARRAVDGSLPVDGLDELPDDEIVHLLTQVRGIGRWTAEMFLIFQLRRLDVWPVDDLGVRKGWAIAHRLADLPTPRELAALGEVFKPHRTVAAWYCWRANDTVLPD